jgi:hypothetical protein
VFVDCTAAGVSAATPKPIFEPGRLTLQYVTMGGSTHSAATVGVVEGSRADDVEKHRLCPPVHWSGEVADVKLLVQGAMRGMLTRGAEPDLRAWNEESRLNLAAGAEAHMDDPRVPAAFARIRENIGEAIANVTGPA